MEAEARIDHIIFSLTIVNRIRLSTAYDVVIWDVIGILNEPIRQFQALP